MFRTRTVQPVGKEQYNAALTEPFRYETCMRRSELKVLRVMNSLSEDEMKVSITTCAPLKKSPNYANEYVSNCKDLYPIFHYLCFPNW